MKTPREYDNMIKSGYITKNLLGEVIYATITRAENWGKKKNQYKRYNEDYYNTAKEKEEEYMKMKEDFFLKINPNFIVKITDYSEVIERYHSNPKYDKNSSYSFIEIAKNMDNFKIKEIDNFFDTNIQQYVDYVDIVVGKRVKDISYSLNYNIGKFNFYKSIESKDILNYRDLDIVECDELYFEENKDLLSSQFCKKVHSSLINNNLIITA